MGEADAYIIRDMCRAMESIIWAVRPASIRALPERDQRLWQGRIMVEIYSGKRQEDQWEPDLTSQCPNPDCDVPWHGHMPIPGDTTSAPVDSRESGDQRE